MIARPPRGDYLSMEKHCQDVRIDLIPDLFAWRAKYLIPAIYSYFSAIC
jgi:hypothetical protein